MVRCESAWKKGLAVDCAPEAGGKVSKTQLTQVGRALKQLGIGHIPAYSPEARGRCERAFRTLQDRLPKELALAGITSVEAANRFIRAVYLPEHNRTFAIAPEEPAAAFVVVPEALWRDVLAIQEERVVGNDNCVAWRGRQLQIPATPLRPHLVRARVRVHDYPDGTVAIFKGPKRLASFPPAPPATTEGWPRDHRDAASPVDLMDNAARCPQPHRAHNSGQLMRYLLRTKQRARYRPKGLERGLARAGRWRRRSFFGAARRIWRAWSVSRSIMIAPRLLRLSSFIAPDPHAEIGGGRGRR